MSIARRWPASTSPLAPLALGIVLLSTLAATSILAPPGLRGPATIAAGTAVILLGFLRQPKPALLVFALFVLFYDTIAIWLGPSVRQIDEAAIPGLVLISLWRTRPWNRAWFEPVRDGAVVTLVVLAIVASLVNGVPAGVWLIGLVLLGKGIAFLYVVLWHDFDAHDVRQFAIAVLAVGVVVLALGFAEAVDGTAFRALLNLPANADVRGQLPGIKSIFIYPVLFAWFTAFVAIFLFSHYVVVRRVWMLAGALMFGAGMFLSGRRRAIVGLALALAGGLVAQIRSGVSRRTLVRLWLPVGGVALVLAIIFLPGLRTLYDQTAIEWFHAPPPPAREAPGPSGIDYVNGNPRLLLYSTAVQIAQDYFPLGTGLGRYASPMSRIEFSPVYAQYGLDRIWGLTPQYRAYITDTFWPQILGEIGVFGLVAYVVFLASLGLALWRQTRSVTDPYLRAFCLGAWMVFLHTLVESLASSMYESPPRIYLAFGCMGVALVLSRSMSASAANAKGLNPVPEAAA